MPGQLNLTGANAAVQLVGSDTITEDQEFVFPDTGGTVVTDDFTGNVEIDGQLTLPGRIEFTGPGINNRYITSNTFQVRAGGTVFIGDDLSSENNITLNSNGSILSRSFSVVSGDDNLVDFTTSGQNIFYRPTNSPNASVVVGQSDVNGTQTGIFELTANGQISARKTSIDSIGSERRIKENIELIDPVSAWETIKSTPYYSYNYIGTDPSDVSYGPIVDEVPAEMVVQPLEEVVIEEAVEQVIGPRGKVLKEGKEAVIEMRPRSDDQGPIRSFDNGMLQARLYTALQSALTRIEALEAELKTLKGATK